MKKCSIHCKWMAKSRIVSLMYHVRNRSFDRAKCVNCVRNILRNSKCHLGIDCHQLIAFVMNIVFEVVKSLGPLISFFNFIFKVTRILNVLNHQTIAYKQKAFFRAKWFNWNFMCAQFRHRLTDRSMLIVLFSKQSHIEWLSSPLFLPRTRIFKQLSNSRTHIRMVYLWSMV